MIRFFANSILMSKPATAYHPGAEFESPEDKSFAIGKPHSMVEVGKGAMKPEHHLFPDNTEAIAKSEPGSVVMEPLAKNIRVGNDPIPPTSVRRYPDNTGKMKTWSVQQRVNGIPRSRLTPEMEEQLKAHPGYHNAVLNAWLRGDSDMHSDNIMFNPKTNEVHNIDNGTMFDYSKGPGQLNHQYDQVGNVIHSGYDGYPEENMAELAERGHLVPEDFRNEILNNQGLNKRLGMIDKYLSHPNFNKRLRKIDGSDVDALWNKYYKNREGVKPMIKENYAHHWNTLANHFNDPKVKTFNDLYSRLYPGRDPKEVATLARRRRALFG